MAESWSITRRRILGLSFLASSTVMAKLGLSAASRKAKRKARVLLSQFDMIPQGLRDAIDFPLIEALHGRRSRRFAAGRSIPDGPFAYQSTEEAVPLGELEQMLLLTAVGGNTGWQYLIPHAPQYRTRLPNYSASAGGRTFPSAAGFHTTELFFTDDDGTYFFPTRDAPSLLQRDNSGSVDLHRYVHDHKLRLRKLSDGRLNIPKTPQHMEMHNAWCANCKGSTLVIPVADAAQHALANLCYLVQNGVCIYDDLSNSPIPAMEQFKSIVDLENPYPLSYIEQMTISEVSVEVSTACYAGSLMLQALGLGGWMYTGLNPFSVLGASGDEDVPGLGFRFDTDSRWPMPNVTGLPDVFEGFCPPHCNNMREAVERLVERKFGTGGPYNNKTPGPYKESPKVRKSVDVHGDQFKDCVSTIAQAIHDRYGRFPATFSPMFVMTYLQAHHLDVGYYDEHFGPHSYLQTHANHMKEWHS